MATRTGSARWRREWIGLAVLALPTLLVTMDLSVLFLAVPKLTRALEPSASELLWITDIYGFLIAGSLVTMGTLGDRIGHKRLLLLGGAAFAIASLVAAFSTSPAMLIPARGVLGIAGATLAPSSLALIRNMFEDERRRASAIGIWISCFAGGAAIGPLLGGVLLQHFWWGSVFLPNAPVMVLMLALGPRLLPESREPSPGRLDPLSAVMALAALLASVYGIKRIAEDGLGSPALAAILAGLTVGTVFIKRQRGLSQPLVDVGLFRLPSFSAALAANVASTFVAIGIELFTAQYLQLVLGMGPFVAGLWSLPSAAGIIAGSVLAPRLAPLARPARLVSAGLVLAALGLLVLTRTGAQAGLAEIVVGSTLIGLGVGPVGALGTDLILGSAPPERAGEASGISETGTELGGALGIAILGSIGAAAFRDRIAGSASVGVGSSAHQTLGGASHLAATLPPPLGQRLLEASHAAFAHGLHVAALVGACVAVAAAVVTAVTTHRERPTDRPQLQEA